MKIVTAIIHDYMLDKLARVLRRSQLNNFMVTKTQSAGLQEDMSIDYLHEMLRIDVFIKDDDAIGLAKLIANTVDTHQEGDGLIFVSEVVYAMNIDTGGTGTGAFQVVREKDL